MEVSANVLRDTVIQSLALTYDWDTETHTRIYLSLDPYEEGVESDRDNFSFVGSDITTLGSGARL